MHALFKFYRFAVFTTAISLGTILGTRAQNYAFDFYGGTFNFSTDLTQDIECDSNISQATVRSFYNKLSLANYQTLVNSLLNYKVQHKLSDWLYYQLIRKTAQELSPKAVNYNRYTLFKWFLMCKSGYDAKVAVGNQQIIFYIKNDEDISDIPFFIVDDKKYMCLNFHDYGKLFQNEKTYLPVLMNIAEAKNAFSYKVTSMPDFKPENYHEKQIAFKYKHKAYHFNVKLTNEVSNIFANYPVVDFESYFNIPLSRETYQSLIPALKENVKKMSSKKGVDYLMRFTRYAFLYEDDVALAGKEKRFSPEQTLLNDQSDCDDRAALFFYLVKELYNLPMIAMLYPTHITMAVQFEKPIGDAIIYHGKSYSVCEPTPQRQDLKIGQISAKLKNVPYQVVYAYSPVN